MIIVIYHYYYFYYYLDEYDVDNARPSRRWYTAAPDSLWLCRLSSGSTKTEHVAFIQQSNPSKKVGSSTIGSVHTV